MRSGDQQRPFTPTRTRAGDYRAIGPCNWTTATSSVTWPREGNMKCFFALLIGLVCAAAQAQQTAPCLKLSKVLIANHVVRQQEDTIAKLIFKARNCAVAEARDRTVPTFESSPGLEVSVSDLLFMDLEEEAGTGITVARQVSLSLKLSASPDLPVGEHTLRGLLSYQVIDSSGNPAPETLAIGFPFKVAPHKPYKEVALPDYGRPQQESGFVHGLKIAAMIVVGIPLVLAMMIWCPISGDCPTC